MRPLPSTTRLSHHRCTSITVLLGEAEQPGYSPLETCGCKQFPVWGQVGKQLQRVERNNLFSCTLLPSKSVGCQVIFLILLLINITARIQALFYFIIPHHIPLLWCHFFSCALSIQNASYHNVWFNKTIPHEEENDSKYLCSITYVVLPSGSKAK